MRLDLRIHTYAVLKNGKRTAFFSTLVCAAQVANWRGAEGVENISTGQTWLRHACLDIAPIDRRVRAA